MTKPNDRPILILGGGINGAAIARELLLNGISVCLVDTGDLARGATACSSRLVHGGLRYLEYAELSLVRESLAERARLLHLAADFVQPLRLYIPIQTRWGGTWSALRRILGAPSRSAPTPRGLWLVGTGLWLYDLFAHDRQLPGRALHASNDSTVPPVASRYRWFYSYHDAQMLFPERFVLALLKDAEKLAEQQKASLHVYPYHEARLHGDRVDVRSLRHDRGPAVQVKPRAIINATGAWVDETLRRLDFSERRLMGGTKGSHFITFHAGLREMIAGRGIYVEANDGRPIFLLPWHQGTLVGTTDEPFQGSPEDARATQAEIEYLLAAVNDLFPSAGLTTRDVALHYAGVRPLPFSGSGTPAAVTRRHWLEEHRGCEVPLFSVIGGKLTTCRSLAQRTAGTVLKRIGEPIRADSRDRFIANRNTVSEPASDATSLSSEQIEAIRKLCGANRVELLAPREATLPERTDDGRSVADTHLPRRFVRHVIRHEWVTCLGDLVERRLMLLYDQYLSKRCLRELAHLMVQEGLFRETEIAAEVASCCRRLEHQFGRRWADD